MEHCPVCRDRETRVTRTHARSSRLAPETFMGHYCRITGGLSSASAPLPSDKPRLVAWYCERLHDVHGGGA